MKTKLLAGYDKPYALHEDGTITGGRSGEPMKHSLRNGYPCVWLYKNKKQVGLAVHRLLAEAFIPNPDNLPSVCHLDGNRKNFKLDNLRWATPKEIESHALAQHQLNNWTPGRKTADRAARCLNCGGIFYYKRPEQKFCDLICAKTYRQAHPLVATGPRDSNTGKFITKLRTL